MPKVDKTQLVVGEMEMPEMTDNTASSQDQPRHSTASSSSAENSSEESGGLCKGKLEGLRVIILGVVVCSIAITFAFILDIAFGEKPTKFHGAVTSVSPLCSKLGLSVLQDGGCGVDAGVVVSLCLALARPDLAGLGGCAYLLVHNQTTGSNFGVDGQCTAGNGSQVGGPGVPGLVPALFAMHKRSGCLDWSVLVTNVYQLGGSTQFPISSSFKSSITAPDSGFSKLPNNLKAQYQSSTGNFSASSTLLTLLQSFQKATSLADLYLSEVADLPESKLKQTDIEAYKPVEIETLEGHFQSQKVVTIGGSSWGGPFTASVMNILDGYNSSQFKDKPLVYHRLVEIFKLVQYHASKLGDDDNQESAVSTLLGKEFADTARSSISDSKIKSLSDYPNYVPLSQTDLHGSSHISIVSPDGQVVSIALTMGSPFGSGLVTKSGVLLNNVLGLFAPSGSPGNTLKSGKRPMSGLAPVVVHNPLRKCGPRMAIGGNHGQMSPTAIVQWLLNGFTWEKSYCTEADDCLSLKPSSTFNPRLHAVLGNLKPWWAPTSSPADILADPTFPADILDHLKKMGHSVALIPAGQRLVDLELAGQSQNSIQAGSEEGDGSGATTF